MKDALLMVHSFQHGSSCAALVVAAVGRGRPGRAGRERPGEFAVVEGPASCAFMCGTGHARERSQYAERAQNSLRAQKFPINHAPTRGDCRREPSRCSPTSSAAVLSFRASPRAQASPSYTPMMRAQLTTFCFVVAARAQNLPLPPLPYDYNALEPHVRRCAT